MALEALDANNGTQLRQKIASACIHSQGAALGPRQTEQQILSRPTNSCMQLIAVCDIDLVQGRFKAYVFQNISNAGAPYVVALVHGDISKHKDKPIPARIHSSCITSEDLGSCDCDCAQQLNGALSTIAKNKSGVLFYLLQEGRGAGYGCKARGRGIEIEGKGSITTFEAYEMTGLPHDLRTYQDVKAVHYLLGIKAPLKLLTNNPSKSRGLTDLGIEVASTEPIAFTPNPYNLHYLNAKLEAGHHTLLRGEGEGAIYPPQKLFLPYSLSLDTRQFSHMASYSLPIGQIGGLCEVPSDVLKRIRRTHGIEEVGLFCTQQSNRRGFSLVQVRADRLEPLLKAYPTDKDLTQLRRPYFFTAHVFHDMTPGSEQETVILTYGDLFKRVPAVRFHSEALFERFPLRNPVGRDKYNRSIVSIVQNGSGAVVLYPADGKGNGFGYRALNHELECKGLIGNGADGIGEHREYGPIANLLRELLPKDHIKLIMATSGSLGTNGSLLTALSSVGFKTDGVKYLQGDEPIHWASGLSASNPTIRNLRVVRSRNNQQGESAQ